MPSQLAWHGMKTGRVAGKYSPVIIRVGQDPKPSHLSAHITICLLIWPDLLRQLLHMFLRDFTFPGCKYEKWSVCFAAGRAGWGEKGSNTPNLLFKFLFLKDLVADVFTQSWLTCFSHKGCLSCYWYKVWVAPLEKKFGGFFFFLSLFRKFNLGNLCFQLRKLSFSL